MLAILTPSLPATASPLARISSGWQQLAEISSLLVAFEFCLLTPEAEPLDLCQENRLILASGSMEALTSPRSILTTVKSASRI